MFYLVLGIRSPLLEVELVHWSPHFSAVVFHRRLRCVFTAQAGLLNPCAHSLLTDLANGLSNAGKLNTTGTR